MTTDSYNEETQVDYILNLMNMSGNDLRTSLNVIANVLIRLGGQYIQDFPDIKMAPQELIMFVTEHRKRNGETIANATIFQGLTMLTWLNGD